MRAESYHFEIKDQITMFISAFNQVVISRYNKSRSVVDKIQVRYLYSPKQRILHDLVNKSQHITLPAVGVSIANIARDETRVFNKLFGTYNQIGVDNKKISAKANFLPAPVPINIGINMSIITKFQTDMDQIISNFVPYNNPYVVISWKVPTSMISEVQEIRSEVLWSGDISLTYPHDIQANQPARVTADTSFTIKGWLFPDKTQSDGDNILYIDSNFTPVTGFDYI